MNKCYINTYKEEIGGFFYTANYCTLIKEHALLKSGLKIFMELSVKYWRWPCPVFK